MTEYDHKKLSMEMNVICANMRTIFPEYTRFATYNGEDTVVGGRFVYADNINNTPLYICVCYYARNDNYKMYIETADLKVLDVCVKFFDPILSRTYRSIWDLYVTLKEFLQK